MTDIQDVGPFWGLTLLGSGYALGHFLGQNAVTLSEYCVKLPSKAEFSTPCCAITVSFAAICFCSCASSARGRASEELVDSTFPGRQSLVRFGFVDFLLQLLDPGGRLLLFLFLLSYLKLGFQPGCFLQEEGLRVSIKRHVSYYTERVFCAGKMVSLK